MIFSKKNYLIKKLSKRWLKQILIFLIIFAIFLFCFNFFKNIFKLNYSMYILISLIIAIIYTYIFCLPRELSKVWLNRFALYSVIFILTAFIISAILLFKNFLSTNQDSSRYMISALIQSEAAILAIVITLTLVGVQQTSSSYSTRIIDVFKKKNPDLWIILVVYIFSMVHGLITLKQVGETGFDYSTSSITVLIYGIFSLVSLIPYMSNTIDLLNPSIMMKLLCENITEEALLSSIHEKKVIQSKYSEDVDYITMMEIREEHDFYETGDKVIIYEKDPIQPIVDIVRGSLRIHDFKTAKYGLKLIGEKINYIFTNESMDRVYCEVLLKHLIEVYTEIGYFTLKSRDIDTMIQIILNLRMVAIHAIDKGIDTTRISAISATENFKYEVSNLKIEKLSKCIDFSLEEIAMYQRKKL